jgi:nitronate monooxygenase
MRFDPADYAEGPLPVLERPRFLAIVSSNTLASTMLKRANGRVDGLVIEGAVAGGHNAPPRGKLQLSAEGEPVYGERDAVGMEAMRLLGVPFWLAGGYGTPEKFQEALEQGATGIQVGTPFAFTEESRLRADYKRAVLEQVRDGGAHIFTDPLASPTGFPFKVVQLASTSSDPEVYGDRKRLCNLGFLREAYLTAQGGVAYRCAAEPVESYVAKGGKIEDTVGRKCLCNALLANVGYSQLNPDHSIEPALLTAGDEINSIARFFPEDGTTYTSARVIATIEGS